VRLALFIVLTAFILPRETLERMANVAREYGYDLATVCERRPDDCSAVVGRIKENGVVLADWSVKASSELVALLEQGVERLHEIEASARPDRGTLRNEDFTPAWRGHRD
jgi:hypothetical protein